MNARAPMPSAVLEDLRTFKLPALEPSPTIKTPARGGPRVLLFARGGLSPALRDAAAEDERLELVDAEMLLAGLLDD